MIITLTPNPAVDQTAWVERLQPGSVHRVIDTQIDPAGKGINVSRMVHRLGWPTIAFGLLAGETGNIIEKALEVEEVQYHFVRVPGQTRVNMTVVDRAGQATSFFGPGPEVAPSSLASLDALLRFWLQAGRVLVLAGSLPPGIPTDTFASYVHMARECGVKVILDADGDALRHGVTARPDLIKPNIAEAERLVGKKLTGTAAIIRAARELAADGIGIVVVSMGSQGAICVKGKHVWRVVPPKVERRSTVGSGDAMVAGLAVALARGDGIEHGLRLGTSAGAATAMTLGTALGTAEAVCRLLPQVQVEALE
ncbi:MAG TPA: 1-phosphofructokinase [Clostridia bacterium]|nr:1-phosphofructokinase [Clostridia bacterium]